MPIQFRTRLQSCFGTDFCHQEGGEREEETDEFQIDTILEKCKKRKKEKKKERKIEQDESNVEL